MTLNRAISGGVYPTVQRPEDVPARDVLMVVACGLCAKPELFNRVGPCLRDPHVGAVVVPPASHAAVQPDPFDATNADVLRSRLPAACAAGLCLAPGALRARCPASFCRAAPAAAVSCLWNAARFRRCCVNVCTVGCLHQHVREVSSARLQWWLQL